LNLPKAKVLHKKKKKRIVKRREKSSWPSL
jgi:hypothetical protein